jgi:hypothetical protein
MSFSSVETTVPLAIGVNVSDDALSVDLSDGRKISVPLTWYPRLLRGDARERGIWRLIGHGQGIHWPELDEDISVENLLDGHPSGESQASLQHWMSQRAQSASANSN